MIIEETIREKREQSRFQASSHPLRPSCLRARQNHDLTTKTTTKQRMSAT
jgi:hypothetical protein